MKLTPLNLKKKLKIGLVGVVFFTLLGFVLVVEHYRRPSDRSSDLETEHLNNRNYSSKNILFLHTSNFRTNIITDITPRQFCAIESAALMNPNMKIYLLIVNHWILSNKTNHSYKLLQSHYSNIVFKKIEIDEYFKDTPLENWWKSEIFYTSEYPVTHLSDVLRFVTLWKIKGIYLDTDVVVQSSLEDLSDFVGIESNTSLNSAVFGLGDTKIGGEVADLCLDELKNTFRGDNWGNNGPSVITRVLEKLCNTKDVMSMAESYCQGFTVFEPSVFFPIHWTNWKLYVTEDETKQTMEKVKNSRVVHMWNTMIKSTPIKTNSQVPYAILARKFCPTIYNVDEIF